MSAHRPSLVVHTVYFPLVHEKLDEERADDPERAAAERLGLRLYDLLTRPREDKLARGPGIPVRVATRYDRVRNALREAEQVVLIPVLGEDAHGWQSVRERAIETIGKWARSLSPGQVLVWPTFDGWQSPLATLDEGSRPQQLPTGLHQDDRLLDEIVLALGRTLRGEATGRLRVYVSHAGVDKTDTNVDERVASGPDSPDEVAKRIERHLRSELHAEDLIDRNALFVGPDLADRIDAQSDEEDRQSLFIRVRSDLYSSQDSCHRALLAAKQKGMPFLTVEILDRGETRSLPYAGNGPTVVWERGVDEAAAAVVRRALVESLHQVYFEREAERVRQAAGLADVEVETLARPPELLDAVRWRQAHSGRLVVLHPDPELSIHEEAVLQDAYPRLRPITPTTVFRGALGRTIRAPLGGWQVALSLSATPDVGGPDGMTGHHVDDATAHLARALIGAGTAIAYGGHFQPTGFTWLLADVIEAYNQTARKPAEVLHSYLAANAKKDGKKDLRATVHSLGAFGSLERESLLAPPSDELSPARRALYYSDMRRVMAEHIQARVIMAGNAVPREQEGGKGYGGRYPGIVEEAWRSLEAGHPLYVAGGFGGASALVAEVLDPRSRVVPAQLQDSTFAANERFRQLIGAFDADPDRASLGLPDSLADMVASLQAHGARCLASDESARKWNGLDVKQNRRLFESRDPLVISSLVMQGLLALDPRRSRGRLRLNLHHGSVTDARDLELLALGMSAEIEPSGAAVAADAATGGAASRAHRQLGQPVQVAGEGLDAEYLYGADLGQMWDALADPAGTVSAAVRGTIDAARRHGFTKIGVVTFLGNAAGQYEDVLPGMIEGLLTAGEDFEFVWFEADSSRFESLRSFLGGRDDIDLTVTEQRAPNRPRQAGGRSRTNVWIRSEPEALDVSVLVPRGNGVVPRHRNSLTAAQRKALTGPAKASAPPTPELEAHGLALSRLLFADDAPAVLDAIAGSQLVITHDASASALPYEALSAPGNEQGQVTPALDAGVVRRLEVTGLGVGAGVAAPPRFGQLGVLLVINPKKDLSGAEVEANAIREKLQASGIEPVELPREKATVDAVVDALQDPELDILHYCGHAFYDGPGDDQSGLKCADGDLTLGRLRGLKNLPRLAFVNACEAGRLRASESVATPAEAFAEYFLRGGINAYLGTFWLVGDEGAAAFAASVYGALSAGRTLGDAVVAGRNILADQGNSDWANYVLYGDASFRMIRPSHGSQGDLGVK